MPYLWYFIDEINWERFMLEPHAEKHRILQSPVFLVPASFVLKAINSSQELKVQQRRPMVATHQQNLGYANQAQMVGHQV